MRFTDLFLGQVMDFCERRVFCPSQEINIHIAEYLLLGCSTVWFRFLPTFRRNISPPASGQVESTGSQFSTYCRLVFRLRKYQLWNQAGGGLVIGE
jgi:hypothetical protein